jgi:hypothetical protein
MENKKRGQISVEYLIVVGFVVFVVISLLGVAFYYTASIQERIKFNQIENYANKIVSNSESVFFAGEPSKASITAHLPKGIEAIEILTEGSGSQLIINVSTEGGLAIVSFESDVVLTGSLSTNEGTKRITLTAVSNSVQLVEG